MAFIQAPTVEVYTATLNQVDFQFSFKFYAATDIIVSQAAQGVEVDDTKVLDPTLYTIVPTGANIGGKITLNTGAAANDTIVIQRSLPVTRIIEFANRGDFNSESINEDQNYQSYLIQDGVTRLFQTLALPITSEADPRLPTPIGDAYFKWDPTGQKVIFETVAPQPDPITLQNIEAKLLLMQTAAFEAEQARDEAEVILATIRSLI